MGVPIDGFMHLKRLGEPKASPDGRLVAFALNAVDLEQDGYRSCIYVYREGAPNAEPFTAGPKDMSPAWSPDGATLAFLGKRGEDKDAQIYVMPVAGGEARRLTTDLTGADGLAWSPDGATLTVVAWRDEPEAETEVLWRAVEAAGGVKPESERADSLILTARLKYRFDGVGYFHDRRRHLRAVPAAGGDGRWVSTGAFDVAFYAWHPSGRSLTIATTLAPDAEAGQSSAAFEIDAAGGEPRPLASTGGRVAGFAWSPDGRALALVGTDDSAGPASSPRLWLFERDTTGVRRLLNGLDRPIGPGLFGDTTPMGASSPLAWDPDGRNLYFPVHDGGTVRPCALDLERPDALVELVPAGWCGNGGAFSLAGARLWCVIDDDTHPAELWELALGTGSAMPLRRTDVHTSTVAAWGVQPAEAIRYGGPGGVEIEAFVVRPAGFREGERHPLFVLVHGGPHGAFGRSFHQEVQHHVSEGRIVLMVNPRGSTGYSQDFAAMCVGDWGGGDYADIMAGVDELVARGWVDTARMAVNGISYGGYMTSWILTHTDRFACAIPEMLISNMVSMFGNSDISYYMMAFEGPGTPWDGAQQLWQHSPLAHVAKAKTPTLLIQGEVDYRCPVGQAEELFVSLRARGVDAVLVRLQGASHGGSRIGPPRQRLARKILIQQWLERYQVAAPSPVEAAVVEG